MKTIYIAGPITGWPELNVEAFAEAEGRLLAAGYSVVNPHKLGMEEDTPWESCMRRCISKMVECDGVALLNGWERSRGAVMEYRVATVMDIPVGCVWEWEENGARDANLGKNAVLADMKITREFIPSMTLEQFAVAHNLVIEVHERAWPEGDPMRYYAKFENCDIGVDGFLRSVCGDGRTPEDAIANYAREITLKRIVIGADAPDRREIDVPRLKPKEMSAGTGTDGSNVGQIWHHAERIKCPKCGLIQEAAVAHTAPFWSYVHLCACGHWITESEWEIVPSPDATGERQ